MIHDEFEEEFAATMDDLEGIDTVTIPPPTTATALTTNKLVKFKRLPEIDENKVTNDISPSSSDILYRVSTDILAAASTGGDLRKTVLINNSANEILSNSPLNLSVDNVDDDDNTKATANADLQKRDLANNNFTNGNKINDIPKDSKIVVDDTAVKTGARRKFTVTRMDSNVLLRPEAEHLKNLSARSNAATISFPCSSSSNRTPLSNLFATNTPFEPHLDKQFFDTSLVRINANSMQSLDTSNASSQDNSFSNLDGNIWERRKDYKPKVQLIVSF